MKARYEAALFALICLGLSHAATAGLIVSNGQEWEVRGTLDTHAGHTIQAATDDGWTWATSADWDTSGLNARVVADPDWSALMGDLDGLSVTPNAFLADLITGAVGAEHRVLFTFTSAELPAGNFLGTSEARYEELVPLYRMSLRREPVPEPATATLVGLALIAMGWTRRRRDIC